MNNLITIRIILVLFLMLVFTVDAEQSKTTQERIDQDVLLGKPVVIHVSVALADNKNQWIVSVPDSIGNGQKTENNLYWGAKYGLKTFLLKDAGWKKVNSYKPENNLILERLVLSKKINRHGQSIMVYLVADAWDGRYITDTIEQFLNFSAGLNHILIKVDDKQDIEAGGLAHLKVYIGHNALMDYFGAKDKLVSTPKTAPKSLISDAVVLACKSQSYFETRLDSVGAHPLLLTTGLMAPESYTLDAAINVWVQGGTDKAVRKAAAASYAKYQKIDKRSSQILFNAKD